MQQKVSVSPTVYAQLQALRDSNLVNMFSEVHEGLLACQFEEAEQWLKANPGKYGEGCFHGSVPTNPDAVPEIDPMRLRQEMEPESSIAETRGDADTDYEKEILNHLERVSDFYAPAETYYLDGSWGETRPLTDGEEELIAEFDQLVEFERQDCYRNGLVTTAIFGERENVTYVEGYCRTPELSHPLRHAWIELNGKVVELTFEEGQEPASDAAYFGIQFGLD